MSNPTTITEQICTECGETDDWFDEDGICASCRQMVWCEICKEYLDPDYDAHNHRHLFYNELHCDYWGSGGYMDDTAYAEVRKSLFALLRHMPVGTAEALKRTIEAGKMKMQYHSDYFTVTSVWASLVDEKPYNAFGDALYALYRAETETTEEVSDGVGWLFTLYQTDTPDANQRTVQWLDEWLATEGATS